VTQVRKLEHRTKVEEVEETCEEEVAVEGGGGGGVTVENTVIGAPIAVTVTCC
jgi:hypothetical protein